MERMSSGHWMGSGCGEYLRRGLGKEEQRWRRGLRRKCLGIVFYLVNKYLLSAYSVQIIF